MQWLIGAFCNIEPGVLVAVLGAEALVLTLIPPDCLSKKWVKFLAALVCFALLWGEITIIKHDRKVSTAQHEAEMRDIFARFSGLHQDILDLHLNAKATQQSRSSHPDNLKHRALDLSNEMLEFLLSREIPPGYGQAGFGEGGYGGGKPADSTAYDKETLDDYFKVFASRVTEIREEFRKHGITDERLDRESSQPVNTYSVRAIAERIGALARSLPE